MRQIIIVLVCLLLFSCTKYNNSKDIKKLEKIIEVANNEITKNVIDEVKEEISTKFLPNDITIKGFYNGMSLSDALKIMNEDQKDIFQYFCKGECEIQNNEKKGYKISNNVFSDENKNVFYIKFENTLLRSLFDSENINAHKFINNFLSEYNLDSIWVKKHQEKRIFLVFVDVAEEVCDIYTITLKNTTIQFLVINSINSVSMEIFYKK